MMENLILLAFGMATICGFILGAQLFVWAWDLWDKCKSRRYKIHQEPRIKEREDYWAA